MQFESNEGRAINNTQKYILTWILVDLEYAWISVLRPKRPAVPTEQSEISRLVLIRKYTNLAWKNQSSLPFWNIYSELLYLRTPQQYKCSDKCWGHEYIVVSELNAIIIIILTHHQIKILTCENHMCANIYIQSATSQSRGIWSLSSQSWFVLQFNTVSLAELEFTDVYCVMSSGTNLFTT